MLRTAEPFCQLPRHGGGKQKAVAVHAGDRETVVVVEDAWQVVGEGRADAHACLHEASLAEGRMYGVSGVQELHHRAGGDRSVIIGLDHGRADHEAMAVARDDIERVAWMKQSDWP